MLNYTHVAAFALGALIALATTNQGRERGGLALLFAVIILWWFVWAVGLYVGSGDRFARPHPSPSRLK